MSTFRCDLHIHSCLSPCGDEDMTPGSIAGIAKLNGLNIAALTDHNACDNCPAFFAVCDIPRRQAHTLFARVERGVRAGFP